MVEYENLIAHNNLGAYNWYLSSDWNKYVGDGKNLDVFHKNFVDNHKILEQKLLVFEDGQKVRVKFPTESELVLTIKLVPYLKSISDIGSSYAVTGHDPVLFVTSNNKRGIRRRENIFGDLKFACEDLTTKEDLEARVKSR